MTCVSGFLSLPENKTFSKVKLDSRPLELRYFMMAIVYQSVTCTCDLQKTPRNPVVAFVSCSSMMLELDMDPDFTHENAAKKSQIPNQNSILKLKEAFLTSMILFLNS